MRRVSKNAFPFGDGSQLDSGTSELSGLLEIRILSEPSFPNFRPE